MPETQRREVPRLVGDELTTAVTFLDFQREAILRKCEDLADEQLRWVGVPTGTNVLGLVNHLVDSEIWWFHHHVDGGGWDGDFDHDMQVAESVTCDPDPSAHVKAIAKYTEAGYDHICVHQVGKDQKAFFEFYREKVLPHLASIERPSSRVRAVGARR